MKKLTLAGSLILTTLTFSAFGQVKPGLANNHVTSISAGAAGIKTATRARVIGRENNKVNTSAASSSPGIATYRNVPEWGNQPLAVTESSQVQAIVPKTPALNHAAAAMATASNSFASAASTQVYRVGVGDVLDIQISQNRARQSTLFTVLEGGLVDYPLAGSPLSVVGLTTAEVADRLGQQIKVFNNPSVTVKVRDYASHNVMVNGFVTAPGIKTLRREAVPLYVVLAEALPLPEAVQATIIRNGKALMNVKLSDAAAVATLVVPGDVIRISAEPTAPSEFFYAGGELNSPGQKAFHSGLTLTQAILASGGLGKNAGTIVRIARQGSDGKLVTVEHNLASIQAGKITDPILVKGDRLEVRTK